MSLVKTGLIVAGVILAGTGVVVAAVYLFPSLQDSLNNTGNKVKKIITDNATSVVQGAGTTIGSVITDIIELPLVVPLSVLDDLWDDITGQARDDNGPASPIDQENKAGASLSNDPSNYSPATGPGGDYYQLNTP